MIKYDGLLDQILRFIHDFPQILDTEKLIKESLQTRLDIEPTLDKEKYLNELLLNTTEFNSNITSQIINLLKDYNDPDLYSADRYFTTTEISKIFNVKKISVNKWVSNGKIKHKQKIKKGKIEIPINGIEIFVNENPIYKNRWINYKNKK
ncbi:MAG: hypothetical protein NTW16_00185 [Bacteroidetes bacterium]|nr:hypothetical protein [Bacteroidota bacterium]